MHAFDRRTDRRTDGQTEFSSLDRVCIACSAVKTENFIWSPNYCFVLENRVAESNGAVRISTGSVKIEVSAHAQSKFGQNDVCDVRRLSSCSASQLSAFLVHSYYAALRGSGGPVFYCCSFWSCKLKSSRRPTGAPSEVCQFLGPRSGVKSKFEKNDSNVSPIPPRILQGGQQVRNLVVLLSKRCNLIVRISQVPMIDLCPDQIWHSSAHCHCFTGCLTGGPKTGRKSCWIINNSVSHWRTLL